MTDYAGEQAMELEALEAILMDDLQIFTGTLPDKWPAVGETYKVLIDPTEEGEDPPPPEEEKLMELLFAHTATYPDEAPCMRLRAVRGLSDADVAAGSRHLEGQVQENLGMAMVFTLVQAAKEWLRSKAGTSGKEDPEEARKKAEAEDEARRAAKRAHGTMCTYDTFMAWKKKFDAEAAAIKAARLAEAVQKDPERATRLTGKQYFTKNHNATDAELEAGARSDDDEEDFDDEDEAAEGMEEEGEEDEEEDDIDYEDDDDEGMLEMYAKGKGGEEKGAG